jgi:hypothetical protein
MQEDEEHGTDKTKNKSRLNSHLSNHQVHRAAASSGPRGSPTASELRRLQARRARAPLTVDLVQAAVAASTLFDDRDMDEPNTAGTSSSSTNDHHTEEIEQIEDVDDPQAPHERGEEENEEEEEEEEEEEGEEPSARAKRASPTPLEALPRERRESRLRHRNAPRAMVDSDGLHSSREDSSGYDRDDELDEGVESKERVSRSSLTTASITTRRGRSTSATCDAQPATTRALGVDVARRKEGLWGAAERGVRGGQ